jgi:hypothetical protein
MNPTESKTLAMYAEEVSLMDAILEASVDPETGEVREFDPDAYLSLKDGATVKAASLTKVVLSAKAGAESIDTEIKRLTRIKRTYENVEKRLKDYALWCMQAMGVKTLGEKPYSLNRQRNSQPAVIVPDGLDLSTWDERFIRRTVEPNRAAIIEAWKADEPIPANVEVVEGEHVRIR